MAFCIQRHVADSVEAMDVDEEESVCGGALATGLEREQFREGQDQGDFPTHWLKMPANTSFVAVALSHSSDEYNTTLALFLSSFSLPKVNVQRIFRIQSSFLWKHFLLKREEMAQEHGQKEVEEKLLFHGTKCRNIDGICRKGFDWRLSARTKFGEGCYFARSSSYSHNYSPKTEARQDLPRALQHAVSSCSPSQTPFSSSSSSPSHTLSSGQSHHLPRSSQFTPDRLTALLPPVIEGQRHSSEHPWNLQPSVLSPHVSSSSHLSFPSTVPPAFPGIGTFPISLSAASSSGPGGLHYMFLARVLVGQTVRGHTSYRRPPALNPGDPYGASFDTCVDCEQDPRIFVVFDCNQAYPEYLLEYSCGVD